MHRLLALVGADRLRRPRLVSVFGRSQRGDLAVGIEADRVRVDDVEEHHDRCVGVRPLGIHGIDAQIELDVIAAPARVE